MSTDDTPASGSDGVPGVSDNVAEDLVRYVRSNTIRNEQQFLLITLGYVSGYQSDADHFLSGVAIGTSSSGKTHLQKKVERLWDEVPDHLYHATGGTDKSMVYDDDWDEAEVASLDELNKLPDPLIEFLKSCHGGDDGFQYKTTTGSVRDGFEAETIERETIPYWFLYAQYEPDFELWNRLLKVPVHESESKNRAVGAMSFDHHHISIGDSDVEYGFDYSDGERALQRHIASIYLHAPGFVHLPNGGEFGWDVWEIVEPIFNHSRSEVNRVYAMVANLIRASALLNYHAREERTVSVPGAGDVHGLVAEPQDLANVLACREVLLATTHEIDRKKRAICQAIDIKSGHADEIEGVAPILEHLNESDAPSVKKSELDNILEDLQDNYLIDIHAGAGDGGDDVYEFLGWDELGFARVQENEALFEGTTDPVSGQPFLEAHGEMRDTLETNASDLMGQAAGLSPAGNDETVSTSSSRTSSSESAETGGLAKFGAGTPEEDEPAPELTDIETRIATHAEATLDEERVEDLREVPVEAFLGLVPLSAPESGTADTDGTLLDPDHGVWDQPTKDDDWIMSEQDARREIKKVIKSLIDKQVIRFETVHEQQDGEPVDATIEVGFESN